MTGKRKVQIAIDLMMAVLLPLLMAYSLIGEVFHEWAGVAMFALFLLHHGLNWKWHKNLFRGRYHTVRIWGTIINITVFTLMISLMLSGITMSRHVFIFLPSSGDVSLARTVHLVASYWCYVLTSFHLGLHGGMLMGILRKSFRINNPSKVRSIVLKVIAVLIDRGELNQQKRQKTIY